MKIFIQSYKEAYIVVTVNHHNSLNLSFFLHPFHDNDDNIVRENDKRCREGGGEGCREKYGA